MLDRSLHDLVSAPAPLPAGAAAVNAYLLGLAPTGRHTQRSALRALAILLGASSPLEVSWAAVTAQEVRGIRARLRTVYAPATVNRMVSALRGVLRAARGLLGREDAAATAEEWVRVTTELKGNETLGEAPAGRALGMAELGELLRAAPPTLAGARVTAMVAVMYGGGLRRDSICKLDVGDYNRAAREITVRKAKGGKTYLTHMPDNVLKAVLERYLELRGHDDGPLFPRLHQGRATRSRLKPSSVNVFIEELRIAAGVDPFTPHDFRRTFGTGLLDSGADPVAAAKLMGHEDVKTTMRYDRRSPERLRELVSKLPVPEDP
jgi:integrase